MLKSIAVFLFLPLLFFATNTACAAGLKEGWYERFEDANQYNAIQELVSSANKIVFVDVGGKLKVWMGNPKAGVVPVSRPQLKETVAKDKKELLVVWVQNDKPKTQFIQQGYLPENLAVVKKIEQQIKPFIESLKYKRVIFVSGSDHCKSGWLVIADSLSDKPLPAPAHVEWAPTNIAYAKRDLKSGSRMTEQDVGTMKEVNCKSTQGGAYDYKKLIGRRVLCNVKKGEKLLTCYFEGLPFGHQRWQQVSTLELNAWTDENSPIAKKAQAKAEREMKDLREEQIKHNPLRRQIYD